MGQVTAERLKRGRGEEACGGGPLPRPAVSGGGRGRPRRSPRGLPLRRPRRGAGCPPAVAGEGGGDPALSASVLVLLVSGPSVLNVFVARSRGLTFWGVVKRSDLFYPVKDSLVGSFLSNGKLADLRSILLTSATQGFWCNV